MRKPAAHRLPLILIVVLATLAAASVCIAQPDLYPHALGGQWDYPLVPADHDGMVISDCRLSPTLPGDVMGTYWNWFFVNNGGEPTADITQVTLFLDGASTYLTSTWPAGILGGYNLDLGPTTIPGGRHTLEMRVDPDDLIAESDETNNNWAHPFVWTPYELTHGVTVTREAPPDRGGGWDAVPSGVDLWYNCDGYRFESVGWWNAVLVRAHDDGDDYDCRLHAPSTGSLDGFAANQGYASRPAGRLDAVLVNRNVTGSVDWDVGVIKVTGGGSDYSAVWEWSAGFAFGDSLVTAWAADEYLQLYEFQISVGDTGWVMAEVRADSPDQVFTAAWFDRDFATGDLADADGSEATSGGFARIFIHIQESGYYCLALYRDPVDGDGACDVSLKIAPALIDFAAYQPGGWHSPMVPRPAPDGAPGAVALPDTLHGNVLGTYTNFAYQNLSPVTLPSLPPSNQVYVYLDDAPLIWYGISGISGWGNLTMNSPSPRTVSGGRHTLTMRLDYTGEHAELDEVNNDWGEQYCWSPLEVPLGTTVTRPEPAPALAGIDHLGSGEPFHYNCDGLRLPGGPGWWKAMVAMKESGNGWVELYECLQGTKDGFDVPLASSYLHHGQSGFVWINLNMTPDRPFDVGVSDFVDTGEDYTAEAVVSNLVDVDPEGYYGPFGMSAGRSLHLQEFGLEAGWHSFYLQNLNGTVAWGMTLHSAADPYGDKLEYFPHGYAYEGSAGEGAAFAVEILDPGYYCLAVWRRNHDDLDQGGSYWLRVMRGATDVSDPAGETPSPTLTRLVGARPNPFNPRTSIAFELAESAEVELAIVDLAGRQVATLFSGTLPAGPHDVAWNGEDDRGRPLPSSTYFALLNVNGVTERCKLALVR